ncbi:MAG: sigma-70 family RNA polymerase sigma factor [Armatimonadetes bacterium]|nr:sigma-70 family RNA polymerase sigma factor [Armatimonadota bacterium]
MVANKLTNAPITGLEGGGPFDEQRFKELMDATYRKVFNMAYRLSGNRPDAEDLTQEAFFRAYRSFNDYEGDKPFENWIFRIVTRLYLDLLRYRRRRVNTVSYDAPLQHDGADDHLFFEKADVGGTPEDALFEGELSEEMERAMSTLSDEQKLLVKLADVEEMPYRDIAELLDKPVGTVRSRLHRTHKQIRRRLEQAQLESRVQNAKKR